MRSAGETILHKTLKSLDMAYVQLERINGELLQARAIANEALNFKKEFVTQTSHELRTPLNLISCSACQTPSGAWSRSMWQWACPSPPSS
ncbi:MAG TPA: hypothetical protein VLE49_14780 [Anaerolineales bacterium]|nr:hypothetical protein [Anaerolineales bacterium]